MNKNKNKNKTQKHKPTIQMGIVDRVKHYDQVYHETEKKKKWGWNQKYEPDAAK